MYYIGVDVDSEKLVCQRRKTGKPHSTRTFPNSAAGYRQFIKWATQRNDSAKVCMEATGVYSLPFALALHSASDIQVCVANPKTIKMFADARLQRGKTDAMDADNIAEFLERMPFKQWQPPSEEIIELQYITRRVVQLNTELTRERNRHLAAKRLGRIGRVVTNDTLINMRHIQRRIDALESEALELIHSIPQLSEKMNLLTSITGIANKTGSRILAELLALPDDMKAKQWVAYAGLDPRPYESGTSINKPRRITKAGNRYLRNALFFPAMVAYRRDANVKAYYEKLINAGKKPLQVIVAIMRKLLLCIWAMFKNNQTWDAEKFYKIP